jgi:hypothetical protein
MVQQVVRAAESGRCAPDLPAGSHGTPRRIPPLTSRRKLVLPSTWVQYSVRKSSTVPTVRLRVVRVELDMY